MLVFGALAYLHLTAIEKPPMECRICRIRRHWQPSTNKSKCSSPKKRRHGIDKIAFSIVLHMITYLLNVNPCCGVSTRCRHTPIIFDMCFRCSNKRQTDNHLTAAVLWLLVLLLLQLMAGTVTFKFILAFSEIALT